MHGKYVKTNNILGHKIKEQPNVALPCVMIDMNLLGDNVDPVDEI